MAHHAQHERQALCDLFADVGPAAPTLCAGWATADLAAHLVLRERRPDAAGGILLSALAGRTGRVQRKIRDAHDWADLVRLVRSGPPVLLRPLDEVMNTVEYFVHHEDVRRGGAAATARTLEPGLEDVLWGRLRTMSKLLLRRVPGGLVLDAAGYGRHVARAGSPEVTVSGAPGELLLWASGRKSAADVTLDGPTEAVAAVEQASFGL
ncbi:MAG: TIGR03085 family metal-binding protein [Acidimicrobiales bacterium]